MMRSTNEVGYWWSVRWRRIWNVEESEKNGARRISTVGLKREKLLPNQPNRFDLHLLTGISKVYVGFTQSSQFSMSSPKTSICSVVSKISYLAWIFTVASRNTSSVFVFGSGKGKKEGKKGFLVSINNCVCQRPPKLLGTKISYLQSYSFPSICQSRKGKNSLFNLHNLNEGICAWQQAKNEEGATQIPDTFWHPKNNTFP